jgi:hypothetical protein
MLKLKLCTVVVLLLALVCCGLVMAGPSYPNYGDPDIYEGVRKNDGGYHRQLGSGDEPDLVIDVPFLGRLVINWQEQGNHLRKMAERLPAALNKDINTR